MSGEEYFEEERDHFAKHARRDLLGGIGMAAISAVSAIASGLAYANGEWRVGTAGAAMALLSAYNSKTELSCRKGDLQESAYFNEWANGTTDYGEPV